MVRDADAKDMHREVGSGRRAEPNPIESSLGSDLLYK
jgi:hypothetical protein